MTSESVSRRNFVGIAGMASAAALLFARSAGSGAAAVRFSVNLTPAQWRRKLSGPKW